MRNTLMTCCVCFSLLCGASVARAGELTTHLHDRYCAPLKDDLMQNYGCSSYWKYRIGHGLDRDKTLEYCKASCERFPLAKDATLLSQCKAGCEAMSKNDN
jgi:hypothetical protein